MPRLFAEVAPAGYSHGKIQEQRLVPIVIADDVNWGNNIATLSIQSRRCSKNNCGECPHGPYAYVQVGLRERRRRIYLGPLPKDSPLIPKPPAPVPAARPRRRR